MAQEFGDDARRHQVVQCQLLVVVSVFHGGPRPKQLVQLHELVNFEDAFEFEDPRLIDEGKNDFDAVLLAGLLYRRVADLVDALLPNDAHLSYEALIVLQNLDRKDFFRFACLVSTPLAHLKLKAGEALSRLGVVHQGRPTQIRQLVQLSLLRSFGLCETGVFNRPCLAFGPLKTDPVA